MVGVGDGAALARLRLCLRTARALIADETGRRRGVLAEGLARYVAWRAAEVDPFWSRFHLAATHATRPLEREELLSARRLRETRGLQLQASAGELLVSVWVARHGDAALGRLLDVARRGEGRPLGPRLEAAGFDVEQAFRDLLEVVEVDIPADPRADVRLPRLRVLEEMSDMRGLRFVAVPAGDVPVGWTVEARVAFGRRGAPQPARRAGRLHGGVHAFAHPGGRGRARIQVGLRPLRAEPFRETLWEEWVQRR